MNVKVVDLMVESVITAQRHQTAEHVRSVMERNSLNCVPVVDPDGTPVGIVSLGDFTADIKDGTPVSQFMTTHVYTVPPYETAEVAARVMRNHSIHHLVVTDEKKITGILSSMDLLKLVEGHRWVPKNLPTPPKKNRSRA